MSLHPTPPDTYFPNAGERLRLEFNDWKRDFLLFQSLKAENLQKELVLKKLHRAADKTMDQAWTICNQIFREIPHPILARQQLYRRIRKSTETFDQFHCELRRIAKDCRLGDQEDTRIMEALVINGNDRERSRLSLLTW